MNAKSKVQDIDTIAEAAREFDSNYLANVLRSCDCYSQDWHDSTTILLRFENNDLLIFEDELGMNYTIGSVNTNKFEELIASSMSTSQETATCICWRNAGEYQNLIGTREAGRMLLFRFIQDEHGDCIELPGNLLK